MSDNIEALRAERDRCKQALLEMASAHNSCARQDGLIARTPCAEDTVFELWEFCAPCFARRICGSVSEDTDSVDPT